MKFQLVCLVLRDRSDFTLAKEGGGSLPLFIETLRMISATVKPFSKEGTRVGGRRTVPLSSCWAGWEREYLSWGWRAGRGGRGRGRARSA